MSLSGDDRYSLPTYNRHKRDEIENPYTSYTPHGKFGLLRKFLALNLIGGVLMILHWKFNTESLIIRERSAVKDMDAETQSEDHLVMNPEPRVPHRVGERRDDRIPFEMDTDGLPAKEIERKFDPDPNKLQNIRENVEKEAKESPRENQIDPVKSAQEHTASVNILAKHSEIPINKPINVQSVTRKEPDAVPTDRTTAAEPKKQTHTLSPSRTEEPVFLNTATAVPTQEISPAHDSLNVVQSLSLWLKSDSHVELVDEEECTRNEKHCYVKGWTNHAPNGEKYEFVPVDTSKQSVFPILLKNSFNNHHALFFQCPLANKRFHLHPSMTFFFVISPANLQDGEHAPGQRFFGNSPYGQFRFHNRHASFYTSGGNMDSSLDEEIEGGKFVLLSYRLGDDDVEISVNGKGFEVAQNSKRPRVSDNGVISIGNVKGECDDHSFVGRIGEILVYSVALDDTQVQKVEQYLGKKWFNKQWTRMKSLSSDRNSPVRHKENSVTGNQLGQKPVTQAAADVTSSSVQKKVGLSKPEPQKGQPKPKSNAQVEAHQPKGKNSRERFDYDSVFEWTPPPEARGADAAQWEAAVKEKFQEIQRFQLGGEVLHAYIRERKKELNAIRDNLFAYL